MSGASDRSDVARPAPAGLQHEPPIVVSWWETVSIRPFGKRRTCSGLRKLFAWGRDICFFWRYELDRAEV